MYVTGKLFIINIIDVLTTKDLKYLVIDEADTLFSHDFRGDLMSIIDSLPEKAASLQRLVVVSATIPTVLNNFLTKEFKVSRPFYVHIRLSNSLFMCVLFLIQLLNAITTMYPVL